TRLLVGWVAAVARWGADLPLGQLGAGRVAVVCGLVLVAVLARRLRLPALALGVAACLWPAPAPPAWGGPVADGARLWRSGHATVLVVDRARTGPLLAGLRRAGVRGVDVVAVRSASATAAASMVPVLERHRPGAVLTPATAAPGTSLAVGRLRVDVTATRPRLEVRVRAHPGPEAAAPANR
ncbi:MAG TPA: hypothetical protein VHE80_05615, partial [Acidimicrobiales bacterium]|nr:hypothetical protein [Acidimicrobiales bacterium]